MTRSPAENVSCNFLTWLVFLQSSVAGPVGDSAKDVVELEQQGQNCSSQLETRQKGECGSDEEVCRKGAGDRSGGTSSDRHLQASNGVLRSICPHLLGFHDTGMRYARKIPLISMRRKDREQVKEEEGKTL